MIIDKCKLLNMFSISQAIIFMHSKIFSSNNVNMQHTSYD